MISWQAWENRNKSDKIRSAETINACILGMVVGDALGVPVEFTSREDRVKDPVTDMRAYGTHHQPAGTWSDDSSMMLATMDSMIKCNKIDYTNIMECFQKWRFDGEYTPYGRVFDIGISCSKAISMYRPGSDPLKCGGDSERDNGNGSLMRIMPVSLYFALKPDYWEADVFNEAVIVVQNVSRITHAHLRSLIGCVLYTSICHELIYANGLSSENDADKKESISGVREAVQTAIKRTLDYLEQNAGGLAGIYSGFLEEIWKKCYGRLYDIQSFISLPESEIISSGYVVHTLEAAIWCLLTTDSFLDCVLKAVNLGDDTDTVGAIAGSLAGIYYGENCIPKKWVDTIASLDYIKGLCKEFSETIKKDLISERDVTEIKEIFGNVDYREMVTSVFYSEGGFGGRHSYSRDVTIEKNDEGALVSRNKLKALFKESDKEFFIINNLGESYTAVWQIPQSEWQEIVDGLFDKAHLAEWDRVYKANILDGPNWDLDVGLSDNRTMSYYGNIKYPPYWDEFKKIINKYVNFE